MKQKLQQPRYIGVKEIATNPIKKRDLLLFDQIAIPKVSTYSPRDYLDPTAIKDLEWLLRNECVVEINLEEPHLSASTEVVSGMQLAIALGAAAVGIHAAGAQSSIDPSSFFWRALQEVFQMLPRAVASVVEQKSQVRTVPLLSDSLSDEYPSISGNARQLLAIIRSLPREVRRRDLRDILEPEEDGEQAPQSLKPLVWSEIMLRRLSQLDGSQDTSVTPVVQIVLDALPMPDESVPWEKILEFREDESTRLTLLELRRWMRTTATQIRNPVEIHEELEYLIASYKEHLSFHRMKVQPSRFEVIVTTLAEVAESVVKNEFAKATKILFNIKRRNLPLLQAERDAPAREVAYIVNSMLKFSN